MYADSVTVVWREEESRAYDVSSQMNIKVTNGQQVMAGDALVEGPLDLRELLDIRGLEGLQHYMVDEVQEVYRSQGVSIHDKHIEVILRQMLRRVEVESAGDTEFLPGDVIDKFRFQDQNNHVLAEGGEPATAKTMLLGVSKAALTTDSFLSKASFQETTKVLTMAAVASDRDWLRGLKENVIIGRLIPARLESLLVAEQSLSLSDAFDEFDDDVLAPAWLSGRRRVWGWIRRPPGTGGPGPASGTHRRRAYLRPAHAGLCRRRRQRRWLGQRRLSDSQPPKRRTNCCAAPSPSPPTPIPKSTVRLRPRRPASSPPSRKKTRTSPRCKSAPATARPRNARPTANHCRGE